MPSPVISRAKLIAAIPQLLVDMSAARAQRGPEPWLHLDLSMPQLKAVMALQAGAMRVGAVARILGLSANATTSLLDHLEERGLTERFADPTDRRAVLVRLTADGEELLRGLYQSNVEETQTILQELSDEEIEALHLGISALLRVMRPE